MTRSATGQRLRTCRTISSTTALTSISYRGFAVATESDGLDMSVFNVLQQFISTEEDDRMLYMEGIIDDNVVHAHVLEEEMQNSSPMNHFHDDNPIFTDLILAAFSNESGDDATEKSLKFSGEAVVSINCPSVITVKLMIV